MQLYDRGIRRRLTTMLHNPAQLKLANSLLFSLPGTPVMRYGDEIAMGDDLNLKERLSVRTPMQWTGEKNAGFTAAAKPYRPIISRGEYAYQKINVETEQKDPNSFLNWITKIVKIRKTCPEFGSGKWKVINSGSANVLAIKYYEQGKTLVTFHNFSAQTKHIKFLPAVKKLTDLLDNNASINPKNQKMEISLNGYGFKWYRIN
jgi:maltose alpha-D-glucosyltransferase/alpha-amylase